jgi:hypothetical protein
MDSILCLFMLTGSTGFSGFFCFSHRFPEESGEKQSACGRKI